jgi:hypothetical protein
LLPFLRYSLVSQTPIARIGHAAVSLAVMCTRCVLTCSVCDARLHCSQPLAKLILEYGEGFDCTLEWVLGSKENGQTLSGPFNVLVHTPVRTVDPLSFPSLPTSACSPTTASTPAPICVVVLDSICLPATFCVAVCRASRARSTPWRYRSPTRPLPDSECAFSLLPCAAAAVVPRLIRFVVSAYVLAAAAPNCRSTQARYTAHRSFIVFHA